MDAATAASGVPPFLALPVASLAARLLAPITDMLMAIVISSGGPAAVARAALWLTELGPASSARRERRGVRTGSTAYGHRDRGLIRPYDAGIGRGQDHSP